MLPQKSRQKAVPKEWLGGGGGKGEHIHCPTPCSWWKKKTPNIMQDFSTGNQFLSLSPWKNKPPTPIIVDTEYNYIIIIK